MKPWNLLAAAIFASACVNTLEGPPYDELAGSGGTGAAVGSSSSTGAMGGTAPQGGNVASGSGGTLSGSSTTGGTGSVGTNLGGTGLGGTSAGGTSGGALGGSGGTGFGGVSGTIATGGVGGAGAQTGGGGVAGSGALTGAGSGGTAGSTSTSMFPAVRDLIVEVCADTACHGSRERPLLTATNLYTTLTSTSVRQCGNDRLVTPGDTANSAILELVNGQCGNLLMPESCMEAPCLGPAEQMIISSWIAAGAPQ